MRILLIPSYLGRKETPIFPLGLSYIAAVLPEHEIRLFDPNLSDQPYAELEREVESFSPDVVGVSLRNIDTVMFKDSFLYYEAFERFIRLVRRAKPDVKIVVGGSAFSMYAEKIMGRVPEIDFGVYFEGEETARLLLSNLSSPEKVKGLLIRKEGEVRHTGLREPPDISTLPGPRWELADLRRYSGGPNIGVQTKRGCALKCVYCVYPFLQGTHLRLRSPRHVVQEIKALVNKHHVANIFFVDNVFNIPLEHAEEICREMIREKVEVAWTAYFSPKYITRDFVRLAMDAGCTDFPFSPDASSDKTLRMLRKEITEQDTLNAYRIGRELGARMKFSFFVNPPGQDLRSFLKLLKFVAKARLSRSRVSFSFNYPRIEPHTELFRIALREGVITENTELLPESSDQLRSLFYSNPSTKYIDAFFEIAYAVLRRSRFWRK